MKVSALDPLVLTVADLEATTRFYTMGLGMELVTFEEGRKALTFGDQKINLHVAGAEFQPHAHRPTPGSADLCFLTVTPIEEVIARLRSLQLEIVEGPVRRTGAISPLLSIYIRDPNGNLVEISNHIADHASA